MKSMLPGRNGIERSGRGPFLPERSKIEGIWINVSLEAVSFFLNQAA